MVETPFRIIPHRDWDATQRLLRADPQFGVLYVFHVPSRINPFGFCQASSSTGHTPLKRRGRTTEAGAALA